MAVITKTARKRNAELDPDEFLNRLSAKSKRRVFSRLVREIYPFGDGKSVIPLESESGRLLGFYFPPGLTDDQYRNVAKFLTPERLKKIRKAAAAPNATLDPVELLEKLDGEDRG